MDSITDDVSRVRKELAHLDPWSFWIVSSTHGKAVDFVVVGTTGAFVIAISSLSGYVKEGAARLIGEWTIEEITHLLKSGETPDYDAVGSGMKAVVRGTGQSWNNVRARSSRNT